MFTSSANTKPFLPATDKQQLVVGSAPSGIGVVSQQVFGLVRKLVITLTNVVITTVDAGAAGAQGGIKIFDFQEGFIQFLSAFFNLTTLAGAGGIADTGALVGSLGTVVAATDNATLTTTEANIIPSAAGTLAGGAGTLKQFSAAPGAPIDGTTTPVDAFLNVAVPDAGSSADDTVTVNGTITIYYISMGDY